MSVNDADKHTVFFEQPDQPIVFAAVLYGICLKILVALVLLVGIESPAVEFGDQSKDGGLVRDRFGMLLFIMGSKRGTENPT